MTDGIAEDVPLPADYDGDGKMDAGVFRPSNSSWYLLRSTAGFIGIAFGTTVDQPIPNTGISSVHLEICRDDRNGNYRISSDRKIKPEDSKTFGLLYQRFYNHKS